MYGLHIRQNDACVSIVTDLDCEDDPVIFMELLGGGEVMMTGFGFQGVKFRDEADKSYQCPSVRSLVVG